MSRSSTQTNQLQFEFGESARVESLDTGKGAPPHRSSSAGSNAPTARRLDANTTRFAGRIAAASASDTELNDLIRERQALLDKKFSGAMSREDEVRLQYVRWGLERIEDARHGHKLEILEDLVTRYENFGSEIRQLTSEIMSYSKGRR